MRIVIDIEGNEVTTEVHAGERPDLAPPPELLKRAASLGAHSAGPAPGDERGRARLASFAPSAEAALVHPPLDAGEAPEEAAGRVRVPRAAATRKAKRRNSR